MGLWAVVRYARVAGRGLRGAEGRRTELAKRSRAAGLREASLSRADESLVARAAGGHGGASFRLRLDSLRGAARGNGEQRRLRIARGRSWTRRCGVARRRSNRLERHRTVDASTGLDRSRLLLVRGSDSTHSLQRRSRIEFVRPAAGRAGRRRSATTSPMFRGAPAIRFS